MLNYHKKNLIWHYKFLKPKAGKIHYIILHTEKLREKITNGYKRLKHKTNFLSIWVGKDQ